MEHVSSYPLTPLLRHLATFPAPARVAETVVRGPGGALGLTTASVWRLDDESLVAVSQTGLPEGVEERYDVIPLAVSMPITIAVRENRIVVMTIADMVRDFPAVAIDAAPWESTVERLPSDLAVFSPICAEGLPIGGLAVLAAGRTSLGVDDYTLIDGIASALALWMSNQRSGAMPLRARSTPRTESLAITERQAQILRLVEEGKSNAQIALLLGYSESTVKQELQRVLRLLRAGDRMSAVARAHDVGLL